MSWLLIRSSWGWPSSSQIFSFSFSQLLFFRVVLLVQQTVESQQRRLGPSSTHLRPCWRGTAGMRTFHVELRLPTHNSVSELTGCSDCRRKCTSWAGLKQTFAAQLRLALRRAPLQSPAAASGTAPINTMTRQLGKTRHEL